MQEWELFSVNNSHFSFDFTYKICSIVTIRFLSILVFAKNKLMTRILPKFNIFSSIILGATASMSVLTSSAQTVTLYRTGVIVTPFYTNLSDAITASSPNDSIVLSPHIFKENGLVINHNLKITGTADTNLRSTIDAEYKNRAFLINNGRVEIMGLVIKHGKVTDGAGAGICSYSTQALTLSGHTMVDSCMALGVFSNGGGVYSAGRLDLLDNTIISHNMADEEGGGVYAYGTFAMNGNAAVKFNKTNGSGGGVFARANGACNIGGFANISDNEAKVAGGGLFGVGTIQNQAKITNNKAENGGGIASFNDVLILEDTATVSGNTVTGSGAGIWLNNTTMYGFNSFHISNNNIVGGSTPNLGSGIYNVNGSLLLTGGVIKMNKGGNGVVYSTSGSVPTTVRLDNTHMYNPLSDGSRQTEVYNSPSLASSSISFLSSASWWGSNDTTDLVKSKLGTTPGTITSFIQSSWVLNDGSPISPDSSSFNLTAEFRLNDGSKMDSSTLRHIQGVFTANKGAFAPANALIDTINFVRSRFFAPAASDTVNIVAYVDADTFRASKIAVKGLSIIHSKALASNISIYPNPATESIYINGAPINTTVQIYSITGQLVMQHKTQQNDEKIELNNLSTGQYIINILDKEKKIHSAKMIKN